MAEKVLAQFNGLSQADQRVFLAHVLSLSATQKHLQTELIERGYFKWDFFTSAAAAAAASSPPPSSSSAAAGVAPLGPADAKGAGSNPMKSISRSISKSFSRSSSSKGYSASLLDSGGLYVDSAPIASEQAIPASVAAVSAQDDAFEAIKEVWKAFNNSDEVIELEEKGAKSQELTHPIRKLGHCCVLLLMLYRSIHLVQSIIDESRISMQEILDKGATIATAKQKQGPSSGSYSSLSLSPSRSSPSPFPSSPSTFGFSDSDYPSDTQYTSDYTQYGYNSDHTITPLFAHVEEKKQRPASMSFSGGFNSAQGRSSPFYFDAFEASPTSPLSKSVSKDSLPPVPSPTDQPSVHSFRPSNPFNPFLNGSLAQLPPPLPQAQSESQPTWNAEKEKHAVDPKVEATLQKLKSTADERYRVFVTTCATLLSMIPEERVLKPMFDEQAGNTVALAQSIQKYLHFINLQSKPSMKERMEKMFNSPSGMLRQMMMQKPKESPPPPQKAAEVALPPVILPWKEEMDAAKKRRMTTAGRIQSRPALPTPMREATHGYPSFLEADLNYVPVLILTPATSFHSEVVISGGKKVTIGRKGPDDVLPPADFRLYQSKVVSRLHAEIWFGSGTFLIRDLKSTSGTFLNAMRLSEQGKESKPFKLVTGDVIQFGVDLRGTEKEEERCVCTLVTVKKVPISLKRLSIRVARKNWHLYSDKKLEKVPLPVEREILSI